MQNDLRAIGLGNKVRCAVAQGGNFVSLAVILGGDDYRNLRQIGILFDVIQKGKAVHHRHLDIQQNQGDMILVHGKQLQRIAPVIRLQHMVLLRQNIHKNFPIQVIILHHKESFWPHHTTYLARFRFLPSPFFDRILYNYIASL